MSNVLNFSKNFILKGCYFGSNVYFLSKNNVIQRFINSEYMNDKYEVDLIIDKESKAYKDIQNISLLLKEKVFEYEGFHELPQDESSEKLNSEIENVLRNKFFSSYDDAYYSIVTKKVENKKGKKDKEMALLKNENYINNYYDFLKNNNKISVLKVSRSLFLPNVSKKQKEIYKSKKDIDINSIAPKPKIFYSKKDDYSDVGDDIYDFAMNNYESLIGTKVDIKIVANIAYNNIRSEYNINFYFGGIMLRELNSEKYICDLFFNKKLENGKIKAEFMINDNFESNDLNNDINSDDYFSQYSDIFENENDDLDDSFGNTSNYQSVDYAKKY